MEPTVAVQELFGSYTSLSAEDRREFCAMQYAWDLKAHQQSNAGKKSAETKRAGKAKAATPGAEA